MRGSTLGDLGEAMGDALLRRAGRLAARVQKRQGVAADLLESDDAFLAVFDVPGAQRHDVQVRYVDGRVEVRIDRFRDPHEGYEMRFPGRGLALDGAVDLPEDAAIDPEDATATLSDNGTLEVEIPKVEPTGEIEESLKSSDPEVLDEEETDAGETEGADGEDTEEPQEETERYVSGEPAAGESVEETVEDVGEGEEEGEDTKEDEEEGEDTKEDEEEGEDAEGDEEDDTEESGS